MKRFFTRHGIIILSAAAAVAVILALVSFFSSNTDLLTNIVNTVSSPFRSAASSVSGFPWGTRVLSMSKRSPRTPLSHRAP